MEITSKIKEVIAGEELVALGPKALITKSEWKRLLRDCRAYDAAPSKEISFALIGIFREQVFLIVDHIALVGNSGHDYSTYSVTDLKKIEKEVSKNGFVIGGIAHTHPSQMTSASEEDKRTWISTVFDFEHPVYFFIIAPQTRKVSCFAIPFKLWFAIKSAIKPVEVAVSE